MTKAWNLAVLLLALGALAAPAPAQENSERPESAMTAAETMDWPQAVAVLGSSLAAALAAAGGAYGVAKIGSGCIESIARQPEAARDMFAPMVVSAGMVEVGMLFAILVCLLKG